LALLQNEAALFLELTLVDLALGKTFVQNLYGPSSGVGHVRLFATTRSRPTAAHQHGQVLSLVKEIWSLASDHSSASLVSSPAPRAYEVPASDDDGLGQHREERAQRNSLSSGPSRRRCDEGKFLVHFSFSRCLRRPASAYIRRPQASGATWRAACSPERVAAADTSIVQQSAAAKPARTSAA
jgi:hypothetical protein